jgi:hypothetical protein
MKEQKKKKKTGNKPRNASSLLKQEIKLLKREKKEEVSKAREKRYFVTWGMFVVQGLGMKESRVCQMSG